MNHTVLTLLATLLACGLAYANAAELIGAPQNPRRVSVGFSLRVR